MFDEINRIIPKMDDNDKKLIYHNIINKSEEKNNLYIFKNKFFYAVCLLIIFLIFPVIYILSINGGSIKEDNSTNNSEQNNNSNGEFEENPGDNSQINDENLGNKISIGNGLAYVMHMGCYYTNDNYILLIKITNLNADKIYIKEFDEDNSISNVVANDNQDIITYEDSVYTIEIKGLKNIEIEIHYQKQIYNENQVVRSINLKYFISASNNSNVIYNYQINEYVIEYDNINERNKGLK